VPAKDHQITLSGPGRPRQCVLAQHTNPSGTDVGAHCAPPDYTAFAPMAPVHRKRKSSGILRHCVRSDSSDPRSLNAEVPKNRTQTGAPLRLGPSSLGCGCAHPMFKNIPPPASSKKSATRALSPFGSSRRKPSGMSAKSRPAAEPATGVTPSATVHPIATEGNQCPVDLPRGADASHGPCTHCLPRGCAHPTTT